MFYTAREISVSLNSQSIFADSIVLSQNASISHPFQEGEVVNTRNIADSPVANQLNISYFLTGKDYLRDLIQTNHKVPLTGNIAGLVFKEGYLKSYSLNCQSNSPLKIDAEIIICNEISGAFSSSNPSSIPNNLQVWNFNDCTISNSYNIENITNYSWNYRATIEPIYYQSETGRFFINPDRVVFSEKEITCDITSDDTNLPLRFTGDNFFSTLTCYNPNKNISQEYSVSGRISKKDFSISTDDLSQSVYSVTQNHLNSEPKIDSVTTSSYPTQNYITVQSPNLTNGYFSDNNNFNLVEKVILGDRELQYSITRGASVDTITGYIPVDAINGNLSIHTSKGLIIYPSQINLNFSGITISGFYPETGVPHDTILISGSNFHRVTNVLFNNIPANFNVYDTTGNFHKLIANVPDNTTIGKINVISSLRNVSGLSTGSFYPVPQITGFTPTGTWSGTCIIAGKNFSGISNVYFNNIKSPSFTVNNNSRITATIPGTGAGYTKGYIKLSGFKGLEALSKTIYQPIVRITGINLISGGIEEDIAISGIFDPDFLYSDNGGHRLSFGNEYSIFYRQNNFTLTGLIPTGSFGFAKPALFEPDGVGKYPPFTGNFFQISAPIIESLGEYIAYSPPQPYFFPINQFQRKDMVLYGKNFNYLFGFPFYVYASGGGELYPFPEIQRNSAGTQLIVKNVRITGAGNAGNSYRIYVRNAGGTSTDFFYVSPTGFPEGLERLGTVSRSRTLTNSSTEQGFSVDDNYTTNSFVYPFGTPSYFGDLSGWWNITFSQPVDFGAIDIYRNPIYDNYAPNFVPTPPGNPVVADTGMLQCFNNDGNSIFLTGISYTSRTVYHNSQIITGVKRLKLFRYADTPPVYLAFTEISIWD